MSPSIGVRQPAAHVAALTCAVALWAAALPGTHVQNMTDFGLVSVLPVIYFIALGVVTISFCVAVVRRQHWALLGAHVLLLIVMLHATPAILYGTLRYSWAWKHVGIVDYITRHGSVNPNIGELSAYHNWPGFFSFVALIVKLGGFRSALPFAPWAPLLNNLLFAGATMFIATSLTRDRRMAWLTVWLFCVTNWVGQDYFSPQATNYFMYLVAIGIALRWLRPLADPSLPKVRRWVRSERLARRLRDLMARGLAEGSGTLLVRRRSALVLILIVIAASIVVSHQLTPFMLILSLTALVIFQLCAVRGLPVLLALLTGTWVIYMTVGFLKGNLYWIVASIGSLNVGGSTLTNLAHSSPDQATVAEVARRLTVGVGVLAAAGLVRRVRHGRTDLAAVLLAGAPVLMVWGNSYGGEVLFRVFFFALPFLAFLVAGLVFPSPNVGRPLRAGVAAAVLAACLLAAMLVAYDGKERMNYFSHGEVRASDYLYSHAPRGSLFVAASENYPWAFHDYELYRYYAIADQPPADQRKILHNPAERLAEMIHATPAETGYLIVTRSQRADVEMNGVLPRGAVDRIESAVSRSAQFQRVYANRDAQIFAFHLRGGRG